MAFECSLVTGSDITLSRDALTIVRKFRVKGTLPYGEGGDAFDRVSNVAMAFIRAHYPTYTTPMGVLHWNSIQLHENFYALNYDLSVTYSPVNHQSGTYQITIDQAVGNVRVTAGERIAGYNGVGTCPNNGGVFYDGKEITGCDVPVAEDKITISYRHPQGFLNAGYIRNIGQLRGYPNSDTFLGYQPGEVTYMGGNFSQTDCEASASYAFAISPNVADLVVAGCTITEKKGFDVISPTWMPAVADGLPLKKVQGIEIIRPRAWKAYKTAFGWG